MPNPPEDMGSNMRSKHQLEKRLKEVAQLRAQFTDEYHSLRQEILLRKNRCYMCESGLSGAGFGLGVPRGKCECGALKAVSNV
jgi:hypothetical protein